MEGKVGIALRTTIIPGHHTKGDRRPRYIFSEAPRVMSYRINSDVADEVENLIGKATERMIFDEIEGCKAKAHTIL